MALTREQFQELRNRGLSVEQIVAFESGERPNAQPQPQKGLLRSIVEDPIKTLIVKPGVRFGQAVGAGVARAIGVPQERIQQTIGQDVSIGGIIIEGQKELGQGGGRQIIGDIAKTGSYIYTGGTGLGLGQLAKTGAVGGGAYAFGDAIDDAEATPASVAYQTMFGAAAGAGTGLLFGGLVKGVSSALKIKKTVGPNADINAVNSKINELNQEVFKPTKTQLKRAGTHDVIKTYTDIFGTDVPQVDANNRFLRESVNEFIDKVNELYRPGSQAFNTILRNSPEVVDLSEIRSKVVSSISRSSLTPRAKSTAIARVNSEYASLLREVRSKGWLRGSKNLPVEFADNYKDVFWGGTRNFGSEESTITNTVNRSFGFAFKDAIETAVKDMNVQDFNRKLGDLITLRDFLQDIVGKQAGTGGKMTRLLAGRVAGTIAGSAGGIPGAIIGNLSGDLIAKIMIDPKMQPYRWLLRKRLAQLPPAQVAKLEQEANEILQKMFERRMARLALPPPTPLGTVGNPIITPSPTTFEPQAQQIGQSLYQRNSASMNPTNTVNKNVTDKTIGQNKKKVNRGNPQAGFIQAYKGESDLTTKILKDLEGKTTVSKQYILDATNRGELKQVERDLIREVLSTEKGDTINVSDFANKVKAELLPLKLNVNKPTGSVDGGRGTRVPTYDARYESITLPSEIRGKVKNYNEHIWESPIKTSAGDIHFSSSNKPNYFGHTRIEEMADGKTVRVIEGQTDLYQKGNLENEIKGAGMERAAGLHNADDIIQERLTDSQYREYRKALTSAQKSEALNKIKPGLADEIKKEVSDLEKGLISSRTQELSKLQQYDNRTSIFRMFREEMKYWASKGKTKLQFPTGETAMKIEGLGVGDSFVRGNGDRIAPGSLKVGEEVYHAAGNGAIAENKWIITDVLGDGKFKAVPKSTQEAFEKAKQFGVGDDRYEYAKEALTRNIETFDISGKVDTNNPIYKFYEKDVQKYLNKFGGKKIVDDKGVSWIEVPIKKEWAKMPVEAFGKIGLSPLGAGAIGFGAAAGARKFLGDKKK